MASYRKPKLIFLPGLFGNLIHISGAWKLMGILCKYIKLLSDQINSGFTIAKMELNQKYI